jgi:predicted dinucleotide-binding enzyme
MHIAVLGTGHMATTLAGGFLAAGHTVTFGSRNPERHADLSAPVVATAEALRDADLVVNALQAAFSLDVLRPLAGELAGRVLLDIGNAVTPEFDLLYPEASLGELLQAALPDTRVVKSLNTLPGTITVDPASLAEPTSLFLSGEDSGAKALVASLIVDLGWERSQLIDLGGIATARAAEHYFLLFVAMMQSLHGQPFNIRVVR